MKFLHHNKFTLFASVIIISLCAFPGDKMPSMDLMDLFSFDKLAHAFCFGLLCFFTLAGLTKYFHFSYMKRHTLSISVAYCLFLGGATEIAQAFLAIHRTGDWLDFFADAFGVAFGAIIYLLIYRRPFFYAE